MHIYSNLSFVRKEIIHFVQYCGLQNEKACDIICTTKKRSNSKAKNNQIICDRNEMIKCKTPKAERSNLCRLIKESKKI